MHVLYMHIMYTCINDKLTSDVPRFVISRVYNVFNFYRYHYLILAVFPVYLFCSYLHE